jgi:RNA polymerase sigma-70 factor, ECF subfamily
LNASLFYENVAPGFRAAPGIRTGLQMSKPYSPSRDETFVLEAVRRVVAGDTEAFSVILTAHQKLIAADLSRRLPAQDVQEVAQNVFLKAFRALPSFRGEAPFRIWLLRIARFTAMDFWRKRYRKRERTFSDLDEAALFHIEAAHQEQVTAAMDKKEAQTAARAWLEAALSRLSPNDRSVLTLVELEDCSMEEAARELGCGLSAVKVRAFRARRRLKVILEEIRGKKESTS